MVPFWKILSRCDLGQHSYFIFEWSFLKQFLPKKVKSHTFLSENLNICQVVEQNWLKNVCKLPRFSTLLRQNCPKMFKNCQDVQLFKAKLSKNV